MSVFDFACWKCVDRSVETPGELCQTCHASEDRKSRRRASSSRMTSTHPDTIEDYEIPMSALGQDLDRLAVRRWQEATGS